MFDKSNMVFSAIRLIEVLKIINWLLSFCLLDRSNNHNVLQRIFYYKFISPLFSILNADALLFIDLISLNTMIYTSFITLEKVVRLRSFFQDSSIHSFGLYTFILTFILGGISNAIAEYMTERPVHGINGSLAACLGYSLHVAPNIPVLRVFDIELKPGEILSSVFLVYLSQILLNRRSTSMILTWVIGAMGGVALYELQVQTNSKLR